MKPFKKKSPEPTTLSENPTGPGDDDDSTTFASFASESSSSSDSSSGSSSSDEEKSEANKITLAPTSKWRVVKKEVKTEQDESKACKIDLIDVIYVAQAKKAEEQTKQKHSTAKVSSITHVDGTTESCVDLCEESKPTNVTLMMAKKKREKKKKRRKKRRRRYDDEVYKGDDKKLLCMCWGYELSKIPPPKKKEKHKYANGECGSVDGETKKKEKKCVIM